MRLRPDQPFEDAGAAGLNPATGQEQP